MKIALITDKGIGGFTARSRAVADFLRARGHDVKVFYSNVAAPPSRLVGLVERRLRLSDRTLSERVTDKIEQRLKSETFDLLISIGNMGILPRHLGCRKIFFCEAPATDESYFALAHRPVRPHDLERIRKLRAKELEAFQAADYVVFPWECYENYVREHVYSGKNMLTVRYGCTPQQRVVSHFFPPSIVYLGVLGRYWNNMELLSYLTRVTPNVIDVYGERRPREQYKLRYRGLAPTLDVLYDYQFGLNTVSKDALRQNAFSSKIIAYLSYGLPCLFPEWQKFAHELGGCVPYNEDNFLDVLERCSDEREWQKLARDAAEQAKELSWDRTLQPLLQIVEKG